jgi:integrase
MLVSIVVKGPKYRTAKQLVMDGAEAIEKRIRAQIEADRAQEKKTGNAPLTVGFACGRYYLEKAQHHACALDEHRNLQRLAKFLGSDKRLDAVTDSDIAALIAWRRTLPAWGKKGQQVSNATINRDTLETLKRVFMRAKKVWKLQLPLEPDWRSHHLKEPTERVRELHEHEENAIDAAVRGDYAPWLDFVRATGLRLAETLIRWQDVDWKARLITTTGKGGRKVTTPITPDIKAILKPLRDNHSGSGLHLRGQTHRAGPNPGSALPAHIPRLQNPMAAAEGESWREGFQAPRPETRHGMQALKSNRQHEARTASAQSHLDPNDRALCPCMPRRLSRRAATALRVPEKDPD